MSMIKAVKRGKPASRRGTRTRKIVLLELQQDPKGGAQRLFRMPVFPILLTGIQQALQEHGVRFGLTQYSGHGPIPAELMPGKTDGVLILGSLSQMPRPLHRALMQVPSIWVMRQNSDYANEFDHVFYDNQAVGFLAARYLMDRGHRHVGFINPDAMHPAFTSRRDNFVTAIHWGGARVVLWEFTREETEHDPTQGMFRVVNDIKAMHDRPQALFVPSDNDLLGVYKVLKANGLEPMRAVDLIGCNNDTLFMSQMSPRPATIDIKLDLVGRRAVEQLLFRMKHPAETSRTQIFITPVLIPPAR